ncbi:MAG: hypothetical protein GX774_18665 [Armatimonadetes bacterium]|nr:hypothetical protein [Armatimonadota bacterium]
MTQILSTRLVMLAAAALLAAGSRALAEGGASALALPGVRVAQAEAPPPPPPEAEPAEPDGTPPTAAGGGRHLQLPDISFIGLALGKLSSDPRDTDRNRIGLEEAEIGIQSYVYPHLRADAYLVAPGHGEFKVELEEGYLTHEQLPLRLSGRLGKFFVPFGRDNQKHPHSWLYVRRPLAWQNLVSHESLTGNGLSLSWLAPTGRRLFLQVDAGTYSQAGHSHSHHHEEAEEHTLAARQEEDNDHGILEGPGANFSDKFYTARAWSGLGLGRAGELELGGSWARGTTEPLTLPGGGVANRSLVVTGVDLSYRRYGQGARRLLLRAEYLWHRYRPDVDGGTSTGYYALANYRFSRYGDFGLLYDWSEIPEAAGQHESALSAIYTHAVSEQSYARLQLTQGARPGQGSYSEAWLQLVWGMGPHTHQLE